MLSYNCTSGQLLSHSSRGTLFTVDWSATAPMEDLRSVLLAVGFAGDSANLEVG